VVGVVAAYPHLVENWIGTREPGTEALDLYTNLKNIVVNFDSARA
jgi:hypothetical protein